MRDIDYAWANYGLYDYVPAPFHYWVVSLVCCLPFFLVLSLLCCISDDEEEYKPQYAAKPSGPAAASPSPKSASPKKSAVRAEKLD